MSDVPRSLENGVSTIRSVVLTADVFIFFYKMVALRTYDGSSTHGNSYCTSISHLEIVECFFRKKILHEDGGTHEIPKVSFAKVEAYSSTMRTGNSFNETCGSPPCHRGIEWVIESHFFFQIMPSTEYTRYAPQ